MICKFCNSEADDSLRVCPFCGGILETISERNEHQASQERQDAAERVEFYKENTAKLERKKRSKLQWIFGILLIIGGAGGVMSGNILYGLFTLCAGALLLPPVIERTGMLKAWTRGAAIAGLLVLGTLISSANDETSEASANTERPKPSPIATKKPKPTIEKEAMPERTRMPEPTSEEICDILKPDIEYSCINNGSELTGIALNENTIVISVAVYNKKLRPDEDVSKEVAGRIARLVLSHPEFDKHWERIEFRNLGVGTVIAEKVDYEIGQDKARYISDENLVFRLNGE